MRLAPAALFTVLCVGSAFAQDTAKAYFVPSSADTPAKVFYADTGTTAPVLAETHDTAPSECPTGAFWVKNAVALVSCADGSEYRLVSLDPKDDLPFKDALK